MSLRNKLIKLAHDRPELRSHLLPLITAGSKQAGTVDRIKSENVIGAVERWAKSKLREFKEFYPDMVVDVAANNMQPSARYHPEIVVDFFEKGASHVAPAAEQYVIDFDATSPDWAKVMHSKASEGRVVFEREKDVYWDSAADIIRTLAKV